MGSKNLGSLHVDAGNIYKYDGVIMTAIAKKLDARMNRWAPETAKKVERLVAEIIELADHDALDLVRSRQVEQEVLDIIDGRQAG
jgi:N-acyl-L-homoserine lactone synthetase